MALPSYGSNGFYDPNSNYGYKGIAGPWGKANSYMDTYPGGMDAELNQDSLFTHQLAEQGYGGLDNKSSLARQLYGRVQDSYGAARLKNNELKWGDFLKPIKFNEVLAGMSYQDRGENPSNLAGFDTRWLMR